VSGPLPGTVVRGPFALLIPRSPRRAHQPAHGAPRDPVTAPVEWRAWLTDLAESPDTRWLNPLWAARSAENKLVQMRVALE
jgi:hypothetical protein